MFSNKTKTEIFEKGKRLELRNNFLETMLFTQLQALRWCIISRALPRWRMNGGGSVDIQELGCQKPAASLGIYDVRESSPTPLIRPLS
jgi:hypothetical protein